VYCKDELRKGEAEHTSFDFLGYTFRPRLSYSRKNDKYFVNFSPAVSEVAQKAMRDEVWDWKLRMRADKKLEDLAAMFNPVVRGWMNYYGKFYPSAMYPTLRHLNRTLVQWAMRKYKRLKRHKRRAEHWLGRIAKKERHLFAHWKLGILPTAD
jgi:RNA-directed DNA polymerase